MRNLLIIAMCELLAATPVGAGAIELADRFKDEAQFELAQRGCMSLSQAVESIRRGGNVEQILSAETRVSGGCEVHHIKVLTKDHKVRTHRIRGCCR